MSKFPDIPPVWLTGFIALSWFLARLAPAGFSYGLPRALGWGLMAVGLLLIVWSAIWFWRRKTTIEPHHAPTALIVEGPYRLSRNPIYLGMALILSGVIVWMGQAAGFILIPIFVTVINRRFVIPEEAMLRKVFGTSAEAYLQATRRWI
ncbi:methyltransferase family protein [Litoreibacter janthinus]|uniref:Protein-S-isoprenylcysteine O-methyltransferase Ste14 n=1 Tax=Litoreibacter janthinus TaxID=670154 RepID=A0A1I6GRG3_9RHOB|nr:isoprenylcysteine carboxylmethyltransferase family protein [Litoreibacter janthinus]SFR44835.1 Protein-S-isoprenylcysteine O-methyltransferase Ste14 [Litoreibacter janthinus]